MTSRIWAEAATKEVILSGDEFARVRTGPVLNQHLPLPARRLTVQTQSPEQSQTSKSVTYVPGRLCCPCIETFNCSSISVYLNRKRRIVAVRRKGCPVIILMGLIVGYGAGRSPQVIP